MVVMNSRAGHYWGCGGVGHRMAECPGRSLPLAEVDGSFPQGPFGGGLKCGRDDMAGAPGGKGGPLRGGSVLGYVNRSRSPVGGAPLGTR